MDVELETFFNFMIMINRGQRLESVDGEHTQNINLNRKKGSVITITSLPETHLGAQTNKLAQLMKLSVVGTVPVPVKLNLARCVLSTPGNKKEGTVEHLVREISKNTSMRDSIYAASLALTGVSGSRGWTAGEHTSDTFEIQWGNGNVIVTIGYATHTLSLAMAKRTGAIAISWAMGLSGEG
ncbi:uncharacterized protein H6S33_001487 [Morchella sextelata]|uniref:uncharacterized protein n=1 Tax=Morchella sextelata TaxID=1174677 RepID=UPI001D057477|nr:uncharacterized protein H6S33_001487 [Morchella sextelata]KAH0608353.1 hypothetical protein H6S33_001487 [Morchella sextelata]